MGKPTIWICENKDAGQLRGLISAFVFATRIVQFLFYLNPKFQTSSSFLCLYRPVCVGPVRKPHCWFSHISRLNRSFTNSFDLTNVVKNMSAILEEKKQQPPETMIRPTYAWTDLPLIYVVFSDDNILFSCSGQCKYFVPI